MARNLLVSTSMLRHIASTVGVRVVAVFEGTKAALVLLAGCGLLALVHRDLHDIAARLILHMHVNPASKYPRIFVDAAGRLTDSNLLLLASLALIYALVRSIEAYGLWRERAWAEWLGVVTGSIYLPYEVYEIVRGATWLKVATFLTNVGVVAFLSFMLYRFHRQPIVERSR